MDKDTYLDETGKAGPAILETLCQQQVDFWPKRDVTILHSLSAFGKSLPDEVKKQVIKDMTEFFMAHGLPQSPPIPAVVRIAEAAQARGLKLALATGSEEEIVHKDYGLQNLFKEVVSSKNVKRTKPQPAQLRALRRGSLAIKLGWKETKGDSKLGCKAARAAGWSDRGPKRQGVKVGRQADKNKCYSRGSPSTVDFRVTGFTREATTQSTWLLG
eukprot:946555-Pelagomonas_calceolata.AAC.7